MTEKFLTVLVLLILLAVSGCPVNREASGPGRSGPVEEAPDADSVPRNPSPLSNPVRVAHVIVALCDNEHQGIVPVSASLGNGLDPDRNLYWGAAYGVRTFFERSRDWRFVETIRKPKSDILERVVFRNPDGGTLLVADAYRGDRLRAALVDFLAAISGSLRTNIDVEGEKIQVYGGADLVAFVGHNGLMDFKIDDAFPAKDKRTRDAVVLACASRPYFKSKLKEAGANPLLWTTNLMAPEAYILHDALEGWVRKEDDFLVRLRAAKAYSRYQKISLDSSKRLFVTGFD